MTPFLQFRIWFRRASLGTRALSAGAAALAVALVVWISVPSTRSASSVAVVNGAATGSSPARTGSTSAPSRGVSSASPVPGGSSAPATGSASTGSASTGSASTSAGDLGAPTASVVAGSSATTTGPSASPSGPTTGSGTPLIPGTTPAASCTKTGKLTIGVVVPTGAGGAINPIVGSPPLSQEEADYAAVFNAINKAGGVDCNDLVGDYEQADLTNSSSAEQGCLQFQQDKVFAVLGGYQPLFTDDCLLQAHIPTFDQLPISEATAKQYFPYYFTDYPSYDLLYRNFAGAVNQMGYFSAAKGFKKIGIFYEDCQSSIHQAMLSALAAVGVSGSSVVSYNLGCSSAFSSPTAIEQAVIEFKADGVTTATLDDDLADGQNISNIAEQEDWHPQWVLPDFGEIAVENSAEEHPNGSEFNGAVAITAGQYGAIASGLPETPATKACDQIMTSAGLPSVYNSPDQFAGSACALTVMLVAAIDNGGVSQTALAEGLQKAGSVALSFPAGPNTFASPGTTWGGEYWRPLNYAASCSCWRVTSATFQPSF